MKIPTPIKRIIWLIGTPFVMVIWPVYWILTGKCPMNTYDEFGDRWFRE